MADEETTYSWAKVYCDLPRDPKLTRRPMGDRWLYAVLILVARENAAEPGVVPADMAQAKWLAWYSGYTLKGVTQALCYFEDQGMIATREDGRLVLLNFERRQRPKDPSSRFRQELWRNSWRMPIYERDGGHCRYCDKPVAKTDFHVDHVIPLKRGGTNEQDNLVTSCAFCNTSKGPRTPEEAGIRVLPARNAPDNAPRNAADNAPDNAASNTTRGQRNRGIDQTLRPSDSGFVPPPTDSAHEDGEFFTDDGRPAELTLQQAGEWYLTEEMLEWAQKQPVKFTALELRAITEEFELFWTQRPNEKRTLGDWRHTWQRAVLHKVEQAARRMARAS